MEIENDKSKRIKSRNKLIIIVVGITIAVIIFSVALWFLKKKRTKEDTNDPKNAPGAVRNFMNDISMSEDGKFNSSKSINQLWEEMVNNGNDILEYLNSAEELAKLIHAAQALDFPDTRENPDEPISWKDIDLDSTEIQGIVKFKRALEDGDNISMTYVTPSEFQELMNKYMETGDEKDKKEALKHFTIEKSYGSSSSSSSAGKVQSLNGMVCMGDSICNALSSALQKEGCITMHKSGCTANYFLGTETVSHKGNCKENNGHFDWDANFKNITNPTGFYLFLGQNFRGNKNTRITQMDELIKKIRSSYPQAPIYINSVYRDMRGDNAKKKKDASEMNEELKTYCSQNISNNVFYSDTLREYDDDDVSLHNHTYDDDHPNAEGARIIIKNMKENIVGDASTVNNSSSLYSNSDTGSTVGTTGAIANTSRIYNNDTFEKDTSISTQKKMSNPFKYNREYRSSQSGCYDGQYIIHFQNKNYRNSSGTYTVDASSKGGRIAWSNLETGEIDFTVEVGAEGGHGDGMAFDSDRNMVLKYSSSKEGNLLQIDNSTKTIVGHTKMDVSCEKITYLNTTKQLVALSGGKFIFMKYDQAQNKYVKQNVVPLKNYKINVGLQGIGTDGQVIYVTDSGPGSSSSNYRVWTYTLEGERVEEHRVSFGGEEPEAVLSDNQGSLWAICNQHLFKIKNYRANPANAASTGNSTGNAIFSNTTYQVKVATWNEHQDKVVSDDPEVQSYDTGLIHEMTTTLIPYQPIVSKFKMPFNYLYTMLVYGQDKNFAFDLAQLVKNSRIEITIHDNVSITKNVSTDTYTNLTTINANAKNAVVSFLDSNTNIDGITQVSDLSANGTIKKNYTVVHTTIYNTDYLDIALTLADAWYTTYEKSYTYNEPTENTSNTSTKLDDKVLDQHGENTLGGLDGKFNNIAIDKAIAKISTITNPKVEKITGKYAHFKTTRTNGVNKLYCYTKSSSYVSIPANDYSAVSSVVTPKTGSLNKNNWVEFKPHYGNYGNYNGQQGFCLVGDDLIACVLHNSDENKNKLNLIDVNTFKVLDTATGFDGHGNTIAFDSKTGDLIIPRNDGKMNLIHVNRYTKKLENIRTVKIAYGTDDFSTIAYNATHDLFISNDKVFTRQAFYSGSNTFRTVKRYQPKGSNYNGGCASYGNQIYHFFARPSSFNENYIVVVNILTGEHEETMCDRMSKEGQGIAFMSDGTLYTCYGAGPTSIWRTDYNYFYDNNINKSNVTPGASGNSVAMYNTGGTYTEKSSFTNGAITKDNVTRVFSNVDYSKGKAGQGFCLIDDQFLVHANANEGSDCDVYLYDIQTQQNCDSIKNLKGHGNSVAYDPIEKNIIVVSADVGKMHILKITNRKLQLIRTINAPSGRRHSLAYNKSNDLFIRGTAVTTREQFYSGSGKVEYYTSEKQPSNTFEQGEGSIGNHEFLVYNDNSRNGKCYISVINLKTRKPEKEIYVNLMSLGNYKNELEEVDFDSNGNMYIAYADHTFYKTSYNYYADASLSDKTIGNSMSDISRYNTGGEYIDKSSFEAIFNSNYNAKTNILSVTGWFFDALEQNSDTKRMVDLTKYLMYKATGTDYGVTEFDFEAYQLDEFIEIGGQGLEGNTTEERVWLALINAGFNDVAAAAAMGNLSYESGGSGTKTIKTDSVEGGYTEDTGGIGMCQWTNNNRGTEGRNAQLKKYAQSKGTTWKDERTQIEFLLTEITGEGNAKGYANLQFMTKTYDGVTYPKDALKTVSNTQDQIEYATKAFAATFERPAASAFTASMSKRVELAKYFYSMYNGKRGSSIGNGDILKACEEVMQNYLSKNVHYSIEGSKLISGNIKRCYNESNYICCATYTSSVLYKSGLLTEKQINEYNYHWTGNGGVPDMLKAAGWRQVPMSQIQPGDVVNDFTVHVLIYAGGDLYYDQGTCTVSSSGKQPTRKVKSGFSYYRNKNVQVWRAPSR